MSDFYHVCFVVPHLEAAMRDLTSAAGVRWSDPVADSIGEWDYRIVFTAGGVGIPHRLDSSGGNVELVGLESQSGFLDTWSPSGRPMSPIDERIFRRASGG